MFIHVEPRALITCALYIALASGCGQARQPSNADADTGSDAGVVAPPDAGRQRRDAGIVVSPDDSALPDLDAGFVEPDAGFVEFDAGFAEFDAGQATFDAGFAEFDAGQLDASLPVSSCSDGIHNGAETDVDCGGPCGTCADFQHCLVAGDCASGECDPETLLCGPRFAVFEFTGVEETFVAPAGRTITIEMWGAGGQNSGYHFRHDPGGGGGGYATARLEGTGQTLRILVGEGPPYWSGIAGPYFGGGGSSGGCGPTGAGGGRSQVALDDGTILLIAGGGGGAGPGAGGVGGAGGGGNGGGTGTTIGGFGGTADSGFAPLVGENADDLGGAGGGGWFGGRRGTGPGCNEGGGGGGGSSYFAPGLVAFASLVSATGSTPGNADDPDRGTAGEGGLSDWAAGTHGRVIVRWDTGTDCSIDNGGCAPSATCIESSNTVSCSCPAGSVGDGVTCIPE